VLREENSYVPVDIGTAKANETKQEKKIDAGEENERRLYNVGNFRLLSLFIYV
jgi:hypothetical protein